MCRFLVYSGSPVSPNTYLYDEIYSLINQSQHARKAKVIVNGDGFGLGWYGQKEKPGLFRDVHPAWRNENLKNLSEQIKSHLFMAHVRAATDTATTVDNCHPFSLFNTLFMHNGQIGGYFDVRRKLENSLSDNLYKFRRGSSDSELIYLLFIQHAVQLNFYLALRKTIALIENTMKAEQVREPFRLCAAYTDGKIVHVARYSSDHVCPSLYYKSEKNSCLIVSEPLNEEITTWKVLEKNSVIRINEKYQFNVSKI